MDRWAPLIAEHTIPTLALPLTPADVRALREHNTTHEQAQPTPEDGTARQPPTTPFMLAYSTFRGTTSLRVEGARVAAGCIGGSGWRTGQG